MAPMLLQIKENSPKSTYTSTKITKNYWLENNR